MIETSLGGLKFPDGTVQTTAGLASIISDSTLTGNGTFGSPLGVSVPLPYLARLPALSYSERLTSDRPGLVCWYLHPQVFNQPEERGIEWARNPEMMQQMKAQREKQVAELKQKTQSNES
jgi:hypothetical protein